MKMPMIMKISFSQFLVVSLAVFLAACSAGKDKTNVELVQAMMDQKSLKAQDYDELRQRPSMLVPPEGTVPRGYTPYKYTGDPMKAESLLVNPIAGQMTEDVLARGQDRYNVYCGICHGPSGQGDGKIAPYFALRPPPLVSDKVKAFKDGRIYHIIVDGQGLMGSYASQIHNEQDRWAIVNYIRALQKK